MNKEELIGKLNMIYAGDKNALNELTGYYDGLKEIIELLKKENQELKEEIKELECIVGLKQKRKLISKFDKEYNEENKKKHSNKKHAEIMPDAEEIYKRYYKQKEVIDKSYIKATHLLDYYNHYKVLTKNIIDELIDIKNDVDILKEVE